MLFMFGLAAALCSALLLLVRHDVAVPPSAWIRYQYAETQRSELYQMPVVGGAAVRISPPDTYAHNPAWSPDGEGVLFSTNDGRYHLLRDGVVQSVPGLVDALDVAWSPDGRELAFVTGEELARISLADALAGKPTQTLETGQYPVWSPDGAWLLFNVGRYQIFRIRPDGAELQRVPVGFEVALDAAWSPDGRELVFVAVPPHTAAYSVHRVSLAGGAPQQVAAIARIFPTRPAWSPDGNWIVFAGGTANRFNLYRVRPDGSDLQVLIAARIYEYFTRPTWSPPLPRRPWGGLLTLIGGIAGCVIAVWRRKRLRRRRA